MQTLCKVPKKIDGEDFVDYHDQLGNEVPDYIEADIKAKDLHQELLLLTESVLSDQATQSLNDTRPVAIASFRAWEDKLQTLSAKADAQDRLSALSSWRQWAIEAASSGAGKAHRWTKVPQAWKPNTARRLQADHDAEPLNLLSELSEKFQKIWEPAASPLPVPNCVVFPSWLPADRRSHASHQTISAQDIAEASKSFRPGTAQTYDGMHVRHWASIEAEGQELLAQMMCLTLALGTLPAPLRSVAAAAIPKATTGYRTIGLFPAYYRVLVRSITYHLRSWEQAHQRKFFSFSSGKSAVLTVWAQAAHHELTSAIGKPSSATVFWDLSDFYEGMSRPKLLGRGFAHDFPAAPAYLSVSAYAGERFIQLNGMVTSAGFPTKGVVAGCGLATYHVQAYHGPPVQLFVDSRPHLSLNIHIDDFCLNATARSDDEVVSFISEGAAALETVIINDLDSKVSIPKADLVATSDALRHRVGKVLEQFGHKANTSEAINLGIDTTGGQPRRKQADHSLRARRQNTSPKKEQASTISES